MGKYISLGEYNKFYNHFWYYLITKLICEYLLNSFFVEKIELLKDVFPKNVLIQAGFEHLSILIFSIFLFKYENKQKKGKIVKPLIKDNSDKNSFSSNKKEKSSLNINFIYNNFLEKQHLTLPDFILIILLFFCSQNFRQFIHFQLKGLDYWMLEILFIALIFSKLYNIPIYKHKKFGILFIAIFCTFFKILSTIYIFIDNENKNKKIYIKYPLIVPMGIIFFILSTFLRAFTFVKIKFIFDTKFILPSNILLFYSLLGASICFIISIIPSIIPCIDDYNDLEDNSFYDNFIKTICQVKENNSTILYYESYSIYFKVLFKNNILILILFILKLVLYFFNKLFLLYIIKNLGAEYLICANSIYFIITEIFDFFCFFFKKTDFKFYKFYGMIAQIFSFLGTLIYLELIELHFCGLDYNLKKSIEMRATEDKVEDLDNNDLIHEKTKNKGSEKDNIISINDEEL